MEQHGQLATQELIESLTGWWELAGVDTAVGDEPRNWLAIEEKGDDVAVPLATANQIEPTKPDKPAADLPANIDILKTMIASGALLPGNMFGPRFVTPVGPANCETMVISDLPDQDELAAGLLGSGSTGILLARMLASVGVDLTNCYWTAMATTIPPTNEVPESAFEPLAAFVRHQIGLVQPKSIILLGSSASKALLAEDLMKARGALRNINHGGINIVTLTTFHPRNLIARPIDKRQAWKDLLMFAKRAEP